MLNTVYISKAANTVQRLHTVHIRVNVTLMKDKLSLGLNIQKS